MGSPRAGELKHLTLERLDKLAHMCMKHGAHKGGRRDLTGAAACQPLIDCFMPLPWQLARFRREDRTMTHPMHPAVFAVFLGALFAVPALAQSFPSKIVRVIVPSPAGSTVDLLARPLARELSAIWGQPVLIENISGGDYAIGATRAAAAAADGHTLFMTNHQPILGDRKSTRLNSSH